MAESAEIPEVDSPFGKRVAVTIAIVAVVMAIISNRGDDAKTDALLKTTQAANRWGYFQAKGIKEYTYDVQARVLAVADHSGVESTERAALIKEFEAKVKRYEDEKVTIMAEAKELEKEAESAIAINNRCDQASLFMQLAVVACSVAILAHLTVFWWGGIAVAIIGIGLGISSFWVKPSTVPEPPVAPATSMHRPVDDSMG